MRRLEAPELLLGDPEVAAGGLKRGDVTLTDPALHRWNRDLAGRGDLAGRQEAHDSLLFTNLFTFSSFPPTTGGKSRRK
jgi:hypothetical protein